MTTASFHSCDDMLLRGLGYVSGTRNASRSVPCATKVSRFKACFGCHPLVCARLWMEFRNIDTERWLEKHTATKGKRFLYLMGACCRVGGSEAFRLSQAQNLEELEEETTNKVEQVAKVMEDVNEHVEPGPCY